MIASTKEHLMGMAHGPLRDKIKIIFDKVKADPTYKPTAEEAALIEQATAQTDPGRRNKLTPRLHNIRTREGW